MKLSAKAAHVVRTRGVVAAPAPIKWVAEPALSVGTERTDRANAYRSSRYAWAVKVDPVAVEKFEKLARSRRAK